MEIDLLSNLTEIYAGAIIEHKTWLQQFNGQRLKKWADSLKADPEAAICEAMARKLLSDNNIDVQPYEDLAKGGPDFICTKNGKTFYVETTCISVENATRISGLTPFPFENKANDGIETHDEFKVYDDVEDYSLMTERIRSKVAQKVRQCCNVKAPRIVLIATLHSQAGDCCFDDLAAEELLTGTLYVTWKINTIKGKKVGETCETTKLENSVFIKPKKNYPNQVGDARNSVSAVLLCGFGTKPPNVIGCLHHNASYSFDRTLLPDIKFCRMKKGSLRVEWV